MSAARWLVAIALVWCAQDKPLDVEATLERWRESLALDLPKEVLDQGRALVAPGAALASDGRALALVAKALFSAEKRGFEAATQLLDGAHPSEATAAYVELERIELALDDDQMSLALELALPAKDAPAPKLAQLPRSWLLVGRAYERSGELQRAIPFLEHFVELVPHDRDAAAALHVIARDAIERGDGATAKACLERAEATARWHGFWRARTLQIREKPGEPLPRLGLGQLWLQIGDGQRARAVLADLVARAPDFAPGWFHLGEAERMLADWPAARAAYDKTLELDPEHVLARNNRAIIALNDGRDADARADLEFIVDGAHASEAHALPAHLSLARLLERIGEHDAAARRYARYVELGGKDTLKPGQKPPQNPPQKR
jgi:tetratricopeptide (TPR) repeat protein